MAEVVRLIGEVEKRPPLYVNTLPEYTDQCLTGKLWKEIATIMNLHVDDCRRRWTSLRNSYARQLKKQSISQTSWYLEKHMTFLKPYMRSKPSNSAIAKEIPTNSNVSNDVAILIEATNQSSNKSPRETCFTSSEDENNSMSGSASTPSAKRVRLNTEAVASLNSEESDDFNMEFFKSLLPDVSKLTARNARQFRQRVLIRLNNMLDEQEEESTT